MDPQTEMAKDMHTLAAPVQFVGEAIMHMLLFAIFVLLFPLLVMLTAWLGTGDFGCEKFIFGVFGPFAITIWYSVVVHGMFLDGQVVDSAVRQEDKWLNHPFLLVVGTLASSFVGEFVAITVNAQNTIYRAVPTTINWRGWEDVGFTYGYRWSFIILMIGALFIPTLVALFRAIAVFSESPTEYYAETQRREKEQSDQWDRVYEWEKKNKEEQDKKEKQERAAKEEIEIKEVAARVGVDVATWKIIHAKGSLFKIIEHLAEKYNDIDIDNDKILLALKKVENKATQQEHTQGYWQLVEIVEALAIKHRDRPFVLVMKNLKEKGEIPFKGMLDGIHVGVGYDGRVF